ncbi:hypothetical protein DAPPUDRAFT_120496 [Daphnia pulex]|uniref:Uncharacterized protein n=1 Tax=Daphnia pulex TaxID=6669 RepID=E9I1K3_DAPPU|nr:hypothetical protein DAPPUDRAFT_120496 [Daphnia pulex]|eukprot:EFX62128.1 hypothetical protein DAPPUDRAFT_120496 [Daphnia pulex]
MANTFTVSCTYYKHKGIADSCATPVAARSETTNLIPHLQKVGGRGHLLLCREGRLRFPPDLLEKFSTSPVGFEIPCKNVDTKEGEIRSGGGRRRSVGSRSYYQIEKSTQFPGEIEDVRGLRSPASSISQKIGDIPRKMDVPNLKMALVVQGKQQENISKEEEAAARKQLVELTWRLANLEEKRDVGNKRKRHWKSAVSNIRFCWKNCCTASEEGMVFLVQGTISLRRNNNGIAVGVGVRAANVDGGENLAIDGNMAFLAGRNAEVDVGGAHAAGGKKKKRNNRRKNLKRKFHTLFVPVLFMTEVTQDTIFNPLTSSLRVKPLPPQEDAPYAFGSAPVLVWVIQDDLQSNLFAYIHFPLRSIRGGSLKDSGLFFSQLRADIARVKRILTLAELFLASTMIGCSDEEILIQGYLEEAKSTSIFLQQVAACREILKIISWKFTSYKKGTSKTYKLLCFILHNLLPFKGVS